MTDVKTIILTALLLMLPLLHHAQCFSQLANGGANMALDSNGYIYTWGANDKGQLGNNSLVNADRPNPIQETAQYKTIASAHNYCLALKPDGTLWAWGSNSDGQLGNGTYTNSSVPVQVGTDADWEKISAGSFHCLAIKTNGTLWSWGYNNQGQLGDGAFSVFGTTTPTQVGTNNNWSFIYASALHSLAIKTNGSLWTWGNNVYGELGHGTTGIDANIPTQVGSALDWSSVSGAANSSFAIKNNGTLWASGGNQLGFLGDNTTVDKNTFIQIGTDVNWKQVSAGIEHIMAVKTNGELWGWGQNTFGQIGNGSFNTQFARAQVGTATNWLSVHAGNVHTLAMKMDGTTWSMGYNANGELGIGTQTNSNTQQLVWNSCAPVSLNEVVNFNAINIFPNPIINELSIATEQPLDKIELINAQGKILPLELNQNGTYNLAQLASGIYFIKIGVGKHFVHKKIIKQ